MASIEQQSRGIRRFRLLFGLVASLVIIAAGVYSIFLSIPRRPFPVPGSASFDPAMGYAVAPGLTDALATRLSANLQTDIGLLAWYQQENRELSILADYSTQYDATSQIAYGAWLVEQQQRQHFKTWLDRFTRSFLSPEGLVYARRQTVAADRPNDLVPADPATVSWPGTLSYLRVLEQAYAAWPSRSLDRVIQTSEASLQQVLASGLLTDSQVSIPTAAPTLDPAERLPMPGDTTTQETTGSEVQAMQPLEAVIRLDSLDLLALQHLGSRNPVLASRYEEALDLVEGGLISDDLPLYAAVWYPDSRGYVHFEGTYPEIDLVASLKVALHLAEVGRLDPRTLGWLSEHLLNDGALYARYHIAQGQPTSGEESLVGYALTARIARITGKEELYRKATDRLQWHLATSLTSQVRDAIFRQSPEGIVQMTAEDNIWALLAFS